MENPMDDWFRNQLEEVPETVPFSTESLWKDIQTAQKTKPRPYYRWVAAACVAVLVLAGLSWFLTQPDPVAATPELAQRSTPRTTAPAKPAMPTPKRVLSVPPTLVTSRLATVTKKPALQVPVPRDSAVDVLNVTPTELIAVETPVLPLPSSVATRPVKRFRVLHANDVQAQQDAQPKLYRSEGFVRLGPPAADSAPVHTPHLSTHSQP
ncbi:hypothetical protein [Siphonobacter curvatus]|uniref:Uncharacterized protein n=1 Tax=Siphonobacter curvatus TaxID=2094562 RepID=A0A2S7IJ38_9BACT|nr:hypothetical protein [Siphonobacter curvatus]PQA56292.1 hypothetical protein C5O19_18275 [Siphonobacter curvatus]